MSDFKVSPDRFDRAATLGAYIEGAQKNQDFWRGVRRLARVDRALQDRAAAVQGQWHLLALSEDWLAR